MDSECRNEEEQYGQARDEKQQYLFKVGLFSVEYVRAPFVVEEKCEKDRPVDKLSYECPLGSAMQFAVGSHLRARFECCEYHQCVEDNKHDEVESSQHDSLYSTGSPDQMNEDENLVDEEDNCRCRDPRVVEFVVRFTDRLAVTRGCPCNCVCRYCKGRERDPYDRGCFDPGDEQC